MLVQRITPHDSKDIPFSTSTEPLDFACLNLCTWEKDFLTVENKDTQVTDQPMINIHIPAFRHFYVQTVESEGGFTLGGLLTHVYDFSKEAGRCLIRKRPENFRKPALRDPNMFIDGYAICCSESGSDIQMSGNNVYVNFQS